MVEVWSNREGAVDEFYETPAPAQESESVLRVWEFLQGCQGCQEILGPFFDMSVAEVC